MIDCVDMYQQPALKDVPDHERHIIQTMKPTRSMKEMVSSSGIATTRLNEAQQTWQGSCSAGTVPIQRPLTNANTAAADRARRAFSFGHPHFSNTSAIVNDWPGIPGKLEVAAAYGTNGPYLGARAFIELWKQDVHPGELSMQYIMIGYTLDNNYTPRPSADPPKTLTNQIIVGLVAWPSLFGDSLSRTFVYYTNDGGKNNNCFNLDCGAFHLVNSSHNLGGSWTKGNISEYGGDKYGITFSIHRDPTKFLWWVTVKDQELGYYPESVFDTRFPEGSYVELGGRVVDTRPEGKHTRTPMGSGMMPCSGSRFASNMLEYLGVSDDGVLFRDSIDRTVVTTPSCYDTRPMGYDTARPGFNVAYGGPGGIYCDT